MERSSEEINFNPLQTVINDLNKRSFNKILSVPNCTVISIMSLTNLMDFYSN